MSRTSEYSRFYQPNNTGWGVQIIQLILWFPHSPVTSSLLGPNIPLSALLSNTFSLRSSLDVRDQVSHPFKNRQNYSSAYLNLYILV
jgi:hypothetical protein